MNSYLRNLVNQLILEQIDTEPFVYEHSDFVFKMYPEKSFGRGRYVGSAWNKGLWGSGWGWKISDDEDIDGFFYHFSISHNNYNDFIKAIKKAGVFELIKKDLLKSNYKMTILGVFGGGYPNIMVDILEDVLKSLERSYGNEISDFKYWINSSLDNLSDYIDEVFNKFASLNLVRRIIKRGLEKITKPEDLLKLDTFIDKNTLHNEAYKFLQQNVVEYLNLNEK